MREVLYIPKCINPLTCRALLVDGATGAVIDGEVGKINVLKWLNHTCHPHCNLEMRFAWVAEMWHALLYARLDIGPGTELTFDYGLVTEDPSDPNLAIPCTCMSPVCRGRLFELREW